MRSRVRPSAAVVGAAIAADIRQLKLETEEQRAERRRVAERTISASLADQRANRRLLESQLRERQLMAARTLDGGMSMYHRLRREHPDWRRERVIAAVDELRRKRGKDDDD